MNSEDKLIGQNRARSIRRVARNWDLKLTRATRNALLSAADDLERRFSRIEKLEKALAEDLWEELAKRPGLSIDTVPSDIEGEPDEWAVYRAHGGRSDREWTRLAQATTPRAALKAALSDHPDKEGGK